MAQNNTTERFFSHVNKTDSCWLWIGAKNSDGYGSFHIGSRKDGSCKAISAHRMSWILERGEVPSGMCVLHSCDNPACVCINHLFLGTRDDNNKDRNQKGRCKSGIREIEKTHCPKGHEYNEANTYFEHTKGGIIKRKCRACGKIKSQSNRDEAKRRTSYGQFRQ